ncbi:MAG: RNA polymerase factor sigma-32, partial [Alphaproteobacteria bacterium]|nr:RNA polymerase factor sigma-32 [Alphaproteobacteria bacterium]
NLSKAKRALGIMDNNLSDEQTKQIADYLNVPEKDVSRMATRISARDLSLNAPINSEDGASDILSNMSDGRESIEDTLEQIEFRRRGYELLKRNLAKMSERDREILVARKLRTPAVTLESLSQKYGISRERVRQIEERAYKKLRDAVLKESEGKI